MKSGDTDGLRACQCGHAIEHARADRHFGGLGANRARRQAQTREHFQAVHQGLGERAPVITTRSFPFLPTAAGNAVDDVVAPSRAWRSLRPGLGAIARRDRRRGLTRGNHRVALPGVVSTIAADDFNWRIGRDLIEQVRQHFRIANVLVRHQRRANLAAVRIHRQMHLAPGAPLGIAVLANLPFAFAKHLQASAVNHQMQRLAAAQGRQHDIEVPGAATQRRVVGNRQIAEGELVHAPRETLQRAQRQAKHLFESEQHLDDRVGVDTWPAALGDAGTGVLLPQVPLHPDRHVTSGDQPGVVGRPVLDSVLALGLLPLLFVLAHRFRQKTRIYASSWRVNSPAAPAVARKRQSSPWPDLCNNATQYDPDQPVVWETWALASGRGETQDSSEVYKADGSDPGPWSSLPRAQAKLKVFSLNLKEKARFDDAKEKISPGQKKPLADLIDLNQGNFEVRMNESAFTSVRSNEMYNIEGLVKLFNTAQNSPAGNSYLQFAKSAKEVKADWDLAEANITPSKLARYHWRKVGGKIYLLTGFHIITKDLPNWFWADFEHMDYEAQGIKDDPAVDPAVDRTTRPQLGSNAPKRGDVDGERSDLANSKWKYYRLRGTQIDFTDSKGVPTRVGNTRIEPGFVHQSSCMTCHARATTSALITSSGIGHLKAGPAHNDSETVPDEQNRDVGIPDATLYTSNGKLKFIQTDFVWSAPFRAAHKK